MRSFILLVLCCLVGWSTAKRCPARYLRFTPQHTFCLSPNPTCQVMRRGVSPQDKELILKLHNQFRSKTAMGDEDRAMDGSLPQAADMIQMEWDDELAAVAQKWTENCQWGHDCDECNAVENFDVGQNLFQQDMDLPSEEPEWTKAITGLYDEVLDYYGDWLDSFTTHPGPITGHFTQVVWSRSWKVGCGYSFYKKGGVYYQYYACNYGPGGNAEGQPVYKQGRPCSACPTNTQCSTSRKGPNTYPGLCKMVNPNTAPVYSRDQDGLLFYCGESRSDPDCKVRTSGDGTWKTIRSVGGDYISIVLSGGQSASITYNNPVQPHVGAFCLNLIFRKGPLEGGKRGDVSSFQTNMETDYGSFLPSEINPETTSFMNTHIDLPVGMKTKLGFTFSVPRGAGKHILDIRKLAAYDGPCPKRRA